MCCRHRHRWNRHGHYSEVPGPPSARRMGTQLTAEASSAPGGSLSWTAMSGVGPGTAVLTSPGGEWRRHLVSFITCSQAPAFAAVTRRTWSVDVTCGDRVCVCVICRAFEEANVHPGPDGHCVLCHPSSSRGRFPFSRRTLGENPASALGSVLAE